MCDECGKCRKCRYHGWCRCLPEWVVPTQPCKDNDIETLNEDIDEYQAREGRKMYEATYGRKGGPLPEKFDLSDVKRQCGPEDGIPVDDVAAMRPILTTDKKARKEMPIARGVLDYFPRAIAEVAHVSYVANEQHNPGEPMHWAKGKSSDHADCIGRHLIERGGIDDDGLRHTAKLAWRALALLEEELEKVER